MKLWKKLAVLLTTLLLVAWLGLLWLNHGAREAWEDYRAEQEAQGVSFDWEDTIPDKVPDKENFALASVLEDEDALKALYPIRKQRKRSDWKLPKKYEGWQASQLFPFEKSYRPEDGDAIAAFKAHYQTHKSTFRSLIEASKLPHCRESIDYKDFNRVNDKLPGKLREVAKGLAMAAAFKLSQNEADTAHELVLSHCRIARHSNFHGTIGFQIASNIRTQVISPIWEGLASRAWDDAQLVDIENHLQSLNVMQDLVISLEQSRIFASKFYPTLLQSSDQLASVFGRNQPLATLSAHLTPEAMIYRNLLTDVSLTTRWLEIAQNPQPSKVAALDQELKTRRTSFFGSVHPNELLALFESSHWGRTVSTTTQAQIFIDLARVGIALERHRLAEGHYPETLSALAPTWLPSVPLDRINQKLLRYQIKKDGTIQVYSIGWNDQDDGGVFQEDYDAGDDVWQYTNPDF